MSEPISFCQIDEFGSVYDESKRAITDQDVLEEFFLELKVSTSSQLISVLHGSPVVVESFDEPLIADQVELSPTTVLLRNPQGFGWPFNLSDLSLDEWDRFHGLTHQGLPFVLSPKAQDQFFNQLDQFDDESITYLGTTYPVGNYWSDATEVESESFWTEKYRANEAGWDLGAPAEGLKSLLPRLKLPSSKIIVLGGGEGHDAALFAEQGHHVTLVDLSPEALARAQKRYGHLQNLTFMECDLFDLPTDLYGQFDIVFEHTCFCAINPSLRPELLQQWSRLLTETGYLLAILFTMPKRTGPPFGGSEWEYKQRLKKRFHTVFWQRLRNSIKPRLGRELLIYAQKKN